VLPFDIAPAPYHPPHSLFSLAFSTHALAYTSLISGLTSDFEHESPSVPSPSQAQRLSRHRHHGSSSHLEDAHHSRSRQESDIIDSSFPIHPRSLPGPQRATIILSSTLPGSLCPNHTFASPTTLYWSSRPLYRTRRPLSSLPSSKPHQRRQAIPHSLNQYVA
jgi:hypothetical protein